MLLKRATIKKAPVTLYHHNYKSGGGGGGGVTAVGGCTIDARESPNSSRMRPMFGKSSHIWMIGWGGGGGG